MLDSGAAVPVIDVQMLKRWNLHNAMKHDPDHLQAFDNRILPFMAKFF